MLKLLRLFVVIAAAAALALLVAPAANAEAPTRFVVPLSPECPEAVASGATGFAYLSINEANGRITYSVAAFNLPGTLTAAHIHGPINPTNGPVAAHLELTGLDSGFVATKSTTDPALAAAIIANPENFYFNLHTSATDCGTGALRGSIG
jgi:hypothetical protein